MAKKLAVFTLTAIMLLGVFGLVGCNNISLADYKTNKKTEIANYAISKGQSNYTTANWAIVDAVTASGKISIDMAESKAQVNIAVTATKDAINRVSKKLRVESESNGELAPPIWTAFTTDESKLKIGDDLTIKFYYAPQLSYDIYDPAPIIVTAKIIMGHGIYGNLDSHGGSYASTLIEEFVLKEINNFADTNNYPVAGTPATAFEEIVISAEWFAGERGAVAWSVAVEMIWADETEREPKTHGGGVALYYRVEGENIILYSSYYNFFNDIRN